MSDMRNMTIAVGLALAAFNAPAIAQPWGYGGPPPGWGGPPVYVEPGYRRPPPRQWNPHYGYGERPVHGYGGPRYQYYEQRPQARQRTHGKVCSTRAGLCQTQQWQPFGSGCRCLVSGVGMMSGRIAN
jgi:hypothetical protein